MAKIKMIHKNEAAGTEIPKAPLYALVYNKGDNLGEAIFIQDLKSIPSLPEALGKPTDDLFGWGDIGMLRARTKKDVPRLKKAMIDADIQFHKEYFKPDYVSIYVFVFTVFPIQTLPGMISEKGYKLAFVNGEVLPFSEAGEYLRKWAEENGFDYARTWFRDKR